MSAEGWLGLMLTKNSLREIADLMRLMLYYGIEARRTGSNAGRSQVAGV